MDFQDPYLNEITCMGQFPSIEKYRFQEIVISKQQTAKSITDASIWIQLFLLIA